MKKSWVFYAAAALCFAAATYLTLKGDVPLADVLNVTTSILSVKITCLATILLLLAVYCIWTAHTASLKEDLADERMHIRSEADAEIKRMREECNDKFSQLKELYRENFIAFTNMLASKRDK